MGVELTGRLGEKGATAIGRSVRKAACVYRETMEMLAPKVWLDRLTTKAEPRGLVPVAGAKAPVPMPWEPAIRQNIECLLKDAFGDKVNPDLTFKTALEAHLTIKKLEIKPSQAHPQVFEVRAKVDAYYPSYWAQQRFEVAGTFDATGGPHRFSITSSSALQHDILPPWWTPGVTPYNSSIEAWAPH